MTNKIKQLIACLLAIYGWSAVCCAADKDSVAVVDIVVEDNELMHDATIEFEIYKDGINSIYAKNKIYIKEQLKEKTTRFVLPLSTVINYTRIVFATSRKQGVISPVNLHFGNNLFLVERGDTVKIHLYPKKISDVKFSGKSAVKYNCSYKLNNLPSLGEKENKSFYKMVDAGKYSAALAFLNTWADSLYATADAVLENADHSISQEIKELIKLDTRAFLYNVLRVRMQALFEGNKQNRALLENMRTQLMDSKYTTISKAEETLAAKSYGWCDLLLNNEQFLEMINRTLKEYPEKGNASGASPNEWMLGLSNRYGGNVKDKLLVLMLLKNMDRDGGVKSYISETLIPNRENEYIKALNSIIARSEGSVAYNFSLKDASGKTHLLTDYKEKVVIIDFWFTGCTGCMLLAKEMKAIIADYEDKSDVLFVSINVDKYRDVWLRSLEQGKYTEAEALNLWTDGLARNHPILAYYNIQSFPTLLIIDKNGLLASRYPPRPINTDPESANRFKELVNKYR